MKDINLVDALFSRSLPFEAAVLCTYGLNLNFFENYLMKLDALYGCESICAFTDAGTYDGFIRDEYAPRWLNRKYLVCRLKTNGVFHPKLYIFASEKRVIAGIGSANLTREGIASNLELLSIFDISEKDQTWAPLLRDCLAFVKRLAEITKSKSAMEQVEMLIQICGRCLKGDTPAPIHFVHNLDMPLITTIMEIVKPGPVSKVQILSPFYDAHLEPFHALKQFFPDSEVEIYLQQKRSNFPKNLFEDIKSQAALMLFTNVDRYLHGKALFFHVGEAVWAFTGSANFTRSALLDNPPNGNYEIGVIGQIDKDLAATLLHPTGKRAKKVKKIDELQVTMRPEFSPQIGLIDYITEAILEDSHIKVFVDSTNLTTAFTPQKFRLIDFNDNRHEQNIGREFTIELTPSMRKKVPGKLAVQILGHDDQGSVLESNVAWVIELEGKAADPRRRRFRRIYNDPFELISVLQEIVNNGDKEELRRFLLEFDIPLDLVLPPRSVWRTGGGQSKGNVEGHLPTHHGFFFSTEIMDAYVGCLDRLFSKLERHRDNPQVNKLSNFIMILSSMFSLIRYIDNDWLYRSYSILQMVSPNAWALVREYYGMLFKYIENIWALVWTKGGYRDAVNARVAIGAADDEQNDSRTFEQCLTSDYQYAFSEVTAFALQAVEHFHKLKETLRVKTPSGELIVPNLFPRDIYLQPSILKAIEQGVTATKNALGVE
jgi:HKD family nuclease